MVQLKDLMQGTQRYVCELRLQAQTVAFLYASSCVIRLVPVFRWLPRWSCNARSRRCRAGTQDAPCAVDAPAPPGHEEGRCSTRPRSVGKVLIALLSITRASVRKKRAHRRWLVQRWRSRISSVSTGATWRMAAGGYAGGRTPLRLFSAFPDHNR
jgi:hypothetical protein